MKIIKRLVLTFAYFFSFFLFIIIKIVSPFCVIRFAIASSGRIGHFVGVNSYYLLKKKYNLLITPNKKHIDFFIMDKKICNKQVCKLISKKLNFLPYYFRPLYEIILAHPRSIKHLLNISNNYFEERIISEHNDVHNLYQIKPFTQLYSFEQKDIDLAHKEMMSLGLKSSDKIVVLINRENNYLKTEFPKSTWLHKRQDSDIRNYNQTVLNLIKNNYKVIRIGLHQEKHLDLKKDNYIDLYQTGKRTDLLEIYLISICKFQIGNYSGGSVAGMWMFNKPTLIVNQIPLNSFRNFSAIFIFKLIYDKRTQKYLSISEIYDLLNSPNGTLILGAPFDPKVESRYQIDVKNKFYDYDERDIDIVENTEEEISSATNEMMNYIENNLEFEKNNKEFKERFIKVIKNNLERYPKLKKFHGNEISCFLGNHFSRKYTNLIK